jgi:hypothetical protein
VWWFTPIIPALRRVRQPGLHSRVLSQKTKTRFLHHPSPAENPTVHGEKVLEKFSQYVEIDDRQTDRWTDRQTDDA